MTGKLGGRGRGCRSGALAAAALVASALAAAPTARAEPVDLELVLAVDASSSVNHAEFDLQMRGLAEAFRAPAVVQALQAVGDRGVAVSLLQWSGARRQTVAIPWTRIYDEATALAFADRINATPRFVVSGGTAIGRALEVALGELETNGFEGRRRVIDVSGDGRTNVGIRPSRMRDLAITRGITINGLAILNEEWALDRYYLDEVIGGTGAFLMTATDYQDFARAITAKLVREISGAPIARRDAPRRPAAPDVARHTTAPH